MYMMLVDPGGVMNKPVKTNLSNEVANYIRKKILIGGYLQDAHLSEAGIADELNVSRGPVREAIKQLEGEGFVFTPNNGRTRALAFDEADFRDYQQMRFYIECDACMKLIDTSAENRGWTDELRHLLETMGTAEQTGNNIIINDCDYHFHDTIIANAASTILNCMWKSLSGIRRSIMETNRSYQIREPDSFRKIVDTHHRIFDCLERGDREGVCLALQCHFRSGKSAFDIYRLGAGKEPAVVDGGGAPI